MHCIAVIVAIHLVFGSKMPNTKLRYWSWNFIKNILRNSFAGLFYKGEESWKVTFKYVQYVQHLLQEWFMTQRVYYIESYQQRHGI